MDRSGNPVQSVNYTSSGVILRLTPQLFEGMSRLAISQEISSFAQTTTGVSGSPTLIKRNISTVVGMSDSDVLVLGGLDEGKEDASASGPGWIPAFFRPSSGNRSKSEVLLILLAERI